MLDYISRIGNEKSIANNWLNADPVIKIKSWIAKYYTKVTSSMWDEDVLAMRLCIK